MTSHVLYHFNIVIHNHQCCCHSIIFYSCSFYYYVYSIYYICVLKKNEIMNLVQKSHGKLFTFVHAMRFFEFSDP
jgi:hypothetical protein